MQMPRDVIRTNAARDCVRVAANSLANAHLHVSEKVPSKVTPAQDRMFTMKSGKFQKMLSTEDFWWYYISRMEAGHLDIATTVLGYEQDYVKTGMLFRAAP